MTAEPSSSDSLLHLQSLRMADYRLGLRSSEQGVVVSVGDGVAWINGLPSAELDEVLNFEDGSKGLVVYLARESIGTVLLSQTDKLTAGTPAFRTGSRITVNVGDNLHGRVIDPLGFPLDSLPSPDCTSRRMLDAKSPPVTEREFVSCPLYSGTKMIDCIVPIGKGQRQLIIGDNGLGKSSICLDAVINQKDKGVYCIYVLIGQKRSTVANIIDTLKQENAMAYTTVVVAEATALPGLQYLAPFAGCAIAENWMWQGYDTLIVYDDLSTHARIYRELSLLLRRPPGREAYPGDIFYLHSRLLERSTALSAECGGGTMTALPIVETDQGEIATYIPTNLISITDGQLYLDRKLFIAGFRPSIDVSRSVSRIGGKAQHPKIKEEVGRMKLDYVQFLELESFTRFGTKLEASVQAVINRGRLLRELLKQERLSPVSVEVQMAWLLAYNDRLLDGCNPKELPNLWSRLKELVEEKRLTLDLNRRDWSTAVSNLLSGNEFVRTNSATSSPGTKSEQNK